MARFRPSRRAALLAAVLCSSAPAAAWAQFAVCNQSFDVVNVAIGEETGGVFETRGWWTIGTNQCANVIRDELRNRFIYVFAMDVFGQPMLRGSVPMCVARPFPPPDGVISGIEDCWLKGYEEVLFFEVDTQAVERWTLFLSPQVTR